VADNNPLTIPVMRDRLPEHLATTHLQNLSASRLVDAEYVRYVCMYVYVYTHTYIHIATPPPSGFMRPLISAPPVYIYIYIYIHTHIHTYIHTCTYTYIHIRIQNYNMIIINCVSSTITAAQKREKEEKRGGK